MPKSLKGRGAQRNLHNRFAEHRQEWLDDFLEHCLREEEEVDPDRTQAIPVFPKSIVNKVESPDVGMGFSLNPYQGCEHGCVYCYARNSHEYWGYGPGLDFERKILYKEDAPKLLEAFIRKKSWQGDTIIFSGNTDCYQPLERKLEITRRCLEVMHQYKHPTGIITKNALVLRDLDLLKEMARLNTLVVHISINTLTEATRRVLEPRTATIKRRLDTVEQLSDLGIPVNVMIAPVIPALNSHEILPVIEAAARRGARSVAHTVVRLNGQLATLFGDWLEKKLPDRAGHILSQIAQCHGGRLNDSQWGRRMKGEGPVADQIARMVALGRQRYLAGRQLPKLDPSHFLAKKDPQLRLF